MPNFKLVFRVEQPKVGALSSQQDALLAAYCGDRAGMNPNDLARVGPLLEQLRHDSWLESRDGGHFAIGLRGSCYYLCRYHKNRPWGSGSGGGRLLATKFRMDFTVERPTVSSAPPRVAQSNPGERNPQCREGESRSLLSLLRVMIADAGLNVAFAVPTKIPEQYRALQKAADGIGLGKRVFTGKLLHLYGRLSPEAMLRQAEAYARFLDASAPLPTGRRVLPALVIVPIRAMRRGKRLLQPFGTHKWIQVANSLTLAHGPRTRCPCLALIKLERDEGGAPRYTSASLLEIVAADCWTPVDSKWERRLLLRVIKLLRGPWSRRLKGLVFSRPLEPVNFCGHDYEPDQLITLDGHWLVVEILGSDDPEYLASKEVSASFVREAGHEFLAVKAAGATSRTWNDECRRLCEEVCRWVTSHSTSNVTEST